MFVQTPAKHNLQVLVSAMACFLNGRFASLILTLIDSPHALLGSSQAVTGVS